MQINQSNWTRIKFPDGTNHVRLDNLSAIPGWTADVRFALRDANDLWELMSIANAVERSAGVLGRLDIPYLMGARYDRVMEQGDAVDLEVVADTINRLGFKRVRVLDPHSPTAIALIRRSEAVDNEFLVRNYVRDNAVLVVPDAGSEKKAASYNKWAHITGVVSCTKTRDSKGNITLRMLNPELCKDRNVVIIDDICDGGGTFAAIAEQIECRHLTLMVTHGIFSKGLDPLYRFDEIYSSDSYQIGPGRVQTIQSPI